MTRIDIPIPTMLCDKHLQSNHREIKRVCNRVNQRLKKNNFKGIPCEFYVDKQPNGVFKELFWLDKGKWTYDRYLWLFAESKKRGFNFTFYGSNWDIYKQKQDWFNDFQPTKYHFELMEQRILSRVQDMKTIRYYKKEISFNEYYNNIWKPQIKDINLQ